MDVYVCMVGSLFSDFIRHAEEFERREIHHQILFYFFMLHVVLLRVVDG